MGAESIRSFFYRMLSDGTDERTKYSLVTESEQLFKRLSSMSIPSLHISVSAILYRDAQFTEKYLATGNDNAIIEQFGLTLN